METDRLDDLCQCVGYTATRTLLAWFAGRRLYVPKAAERGHPLWVLLGGRAFTRLVDALGGTQVRIPPGDSERNARRLRNIAERLARGETIEALAKGLNISTRRVQMIRVHLTEKGWIDYAAGRRAAPRLVVENLGTGGVFDEPPPPSRGPRPT